VGNLGDRRGLRKGGGFDTEFREGCLSRNKKRIKNNIKEGSNQGILLQVKDKLRLFLPFGESAGGESSKHNPTLLRSREGSGGGGGVTKKRKIWGKKKKLIDIGEGQAKDKSYGRGRPQNNEKYRQFQLKQGTSLRRRKAVGQARHGATQVIETKPIWTRNIEEGGSLLGEEPCFIST